MTDPDDLKIDTTPTLKPTAIWLLLIITLGVSIILYVYFQRDSLANPQTADILMRAIALLTLIVVIRLVIRLFILSRTRYLVDSVRITKRFDLLYRRRRQEVPLSKVRSHELRQSRIQTVLGFGTIRLNQGLGPIELENIPEPHQVYEQINRLLQ
jgi:Bacterial membrane flanked domain.